MKIQIHHEELDVEIELDGTAIEKLATDPSIIQKFCTNRLEVMDRVAKSETLQNYIATVVSCVTIGIIRAFRRVEDEPKIPVVARIWNSLKAHILKTFQEGPAEEADAA